MASCDNMNSIHEDTGELLEIEEYAQQENVDSQFSCGIHSVDSHWHKWKCTFSSIMPYSYWSRSTQGKEAHIMHVKYPESCSTDA